MYQKLFIKINVSTVFLTKKSEVDRDKISKAFYRMILVLHHWFAPACIIILFLGGLLPAARAQDGAPFPTPNSYAACNMTSKQLLELDGSTPVAPCILYDTNPRQGVTNTSVITVVGVFSSLCAVHRDGAWLAVERINEDNNGTGAAIGYNQDHRLQIRLVVGIAGNSQQMDPTDHAQVHGDMLESLILQYNPQYILGSCSFHAALDKPIAGKYERILVSQVGPYSYYQDDSNEYVFGAHIPSETYGLPAYQAFKFSVTNRTRQKIRIVHRDRSDFFKSTCRAILDRAIQDGFTDSLAVSYNPEEDHNNDGIMNSDDVDFLRAIANETCPAVEANKDVAIWACVMTDTEANTMLDQWKANGCRLSSLWMTVASWAYASKYRENIPHMQAGAQFHKAIKYSDEYFENGQAMLDYGTSRLGYTMEYGATGAYHAIYLMFKNTESFVKTQDDPQIDAMYQERYEEVRRHMLGLNIRKSLYGPTNFDENRRNVGRGSVGFQWGIPFRSPNKNFELLMVAPVDQAEATVVVPSPASLGCSGGHFVNRSKVIQDAAILASKCDSCPVDTYRSADMAPFECRPCQDGSATDGAAGSEQCTRLEEHLMPQWLLVFGHTIMSLVFLCAFSCIAWTFYHWKDAVVLISQPDFLLLICFGSILSSSSIIPISMQAGVSEDTLLVDGACIAIPWLYSSGWILQYSSLFAKTFRMHTLVSNSSSMRRVTVTAIGMGKIVLIALLVNWAVLIPWTVLDPLEWQREYLGIDVDERSGVVTISSVGKCTCNNFGAWAGSLLSFHLVIMIAANLLLWQLRSVSDRYQEAKYVALATFLALEFLILGLPILISVGDSTEARHLVLVCIISLNDLVLLLMIFVPKMYFQRKGLPEGFSVHQTIIRANRTASRQSAIAHSSSFPPASSNALVIDAQALSASTADNAAEQDSSKLSIDIQEQAFAASASDSAVQRKSSGISCDAQEQGLSLSAADNATI